MDLELVFIQELLDFLSHGKQKKHPRPSNNPVREMLIVMLAGQGKYNSL